MWSIYPKRDGEFEIEDFSERNLLIKLDNHPRFRYFTMSKVADSKCIYKYKWQERGPSNNDFNNVIID